MLIEISQIVKQFIRYTIRASTDNDTNNIFYL